LSAVLVYLASLMLKSLGLGSIHCSDFGTELSSRICYYGLEGKSSSKTSLLWSEQLSAYSPLNFSGVDIRMHFGIKGG
jgi:hypothetical protein